jgi:hypothetical protein
MKPYWTNAQLSAVLADMQMWERNSPAIAIFLGPKFKRFRDQNRMRIQSLQKGWQDMIDKYVQKDDKGQPEMMKHEGRDKFRFKSDEDEKKYEDEYKELMGKGFDVEV